MSITVRPMGSEEDHTALDAGSPLGPLADSWRALPPDPARPVAWWVASLDDEPVGYAAVSLAPHADDGYAEALLHVRPAARCHGVGTALREAVEDAVRDRGLPGVRYAQADGDHDGAAAVAAWGLVGSDGRPGGGPVAAEPGTLVVRVPLRGLEAMLPTARRVFETTRNAVWKRDLDQVLDLFAPDAVLLGLTDSCLDRAAVEAYLGAMVAADTEPLWWQFDEVRVVAGTPTTLDVVAVGTVGVRSQPFETREAARLSGHLVLDPDGAWRWRLFHGSVPEA